MPLQQLTLSGISFSPAATLPASWSNLTALRSLTLYGVGGLSGPLPSSWPGALSNLTALQLSYSSGLTSGLHDYATLAAGCANLSSLQLAGMGLSGALTALLQPLLGAANSSRCGCWLHCIEMTASWCACH